MKKGIIYFCLLLILLGIMIIVSQVFLQKYEITSTEQLNQANQENNNELANETSKEEQNTTNTINFEEIMEKEKEKTYTIPEGSLLQKLKEQKLPVILYFGADYCPKCNQLKPIMEKVKEKVQGKAIIEYVDKIEEPDIIKDYPITLIPTIFFVNADGTAYNGKKIEEKKFVQYHDEQGNHTATSYVGTLTEEEIMEILKEMGMEE